MHLSHVSLPLGTGSELPMFLPLLRPGPAQPLTDKILTYLFKPQFSEEGSNSRVFENAVYAKFLSTRGKQEVSQ